MINSTKIDYNTTLLNAASNLAYQALAPSAVGMAISAIISKIGHSVLGVNRGTNQSAAVLLTSTFAGTAAGAYASSLLPIRIFTFSVATYSISCGLSLAIATAILPKLGLIRASKEARLPVYQLATAFVIAPAIGAASPYISIACAGIGALTGAGLIDVESAWQKIEPFI